MISRYDFPQEDKWSEICKRVSADDNSITVVVQDIINEVNSKGDLALRDYTLKLDKVKLDSIEVSGKEIEEACLLVSNELKEAIYLAKDNIYKFHKSQEDEQPKIETTKGVVCWRKSVGIEKVGLYIPGGSAPLFSTILMLGIPAKIAGCKEIILCTPPDKNGCVNPVVLYVAKLVGIDRIFKVGGAQAIAAMAYGTETIIKVNKIFGPGNQYVTKAKELVQQNGIAIDMPAGPSEVLVIADNSCNPEFVAADMLSQLEHGVDSQAVLLSDSSEVLDKVNTEIYAQLERLPRRNIVDESLKGSSMILLSSMEKCVDFSNVYAPEHLIIASGDTDRYINDIINAGSVFLGNYSCESAGDYASGTNHTLPTNGYAKSYSGVSLDSFVRKITFQNISEEGIVNIGFAIELMAEAEGLFAHKNAVTVRLNSIKDV